MHWAGGVMLRSFKTLVAMAALAGALAVPASVLAQAAPAVAPAPMAAPGVAPAPTLLAQPGTFNGKWVYRSFSVSSKSTETLAKLALGLNELTLTEQGGRVTGQRTGQGVTYTVDGIVRYAPKEGATISLHGTATISGKSYNYDYFGYLIPSWTVGGKQPDTIMGTVLRTDPANPSAAPLIASFAMTRE